jgi:2-oxoisovalerate dehydrogenase E1 component
MISHLGAMLPVADGLALAAKLRGETRVAAAFTGDGATSEGDFHEALNLAAVWKLPVLFVIENNQWGLSTPSHEQYACKQLADRALGYGMPGTIVDGNDVLAVHRAVRRAADRARRGDGPSLLEFKTFRMRGHEEASGTDYVPREQVEEWAKRDPLARLEGHLLGSSVLKETEPAALREAYKARIDTLVDEAIAAREPHATAESLIADVYAVRPVKPAPPTPEALAAAPERRYVDAISDGLREAMRRDAMVLLLGQDIAEYGGVFKVTDGFAEEFGKARCATRPSSNPEPSEWPSASPSTDSGPWSRCSSAISSAAASTRSSTTSPRTTSVGAPPFRW